MAEASRFATPNLRPEQTMELIATFAALAFIAAVPTALYLHLARTDNTEK
jgi:hypothetical protein